MEINWLELWQDLINANPHISNGEPMKRYRTHAQQRRQRPDPLLDYVVQSIDNNVTVLDIGAGNGRWTVPLAQKAKAVTAVEPAADMLEMLNENLQSSRLKVQVVQSSWEEAQVETYDIAICAHAMYSSPNLKSFVRKMEQHARKSCYLEIRLPPVDGVIGDLAHSIYGRLYDSANAMVAYNALYSLGIYANMLVENEIYPWVNDSFEEAFQRAKRHLHLNSTAAYDQLIQDTLRKRLTLRNNLYIWPDGMRSALLWWNT
jgi:SAM-dependent methyltransferase